MAAIDQKTRLIAIETALGPDRVGLRSVSVKEQLGRPFEIHAELSSEDGEIEFEKIVGHDATIRIQVGQDDTRFFNGIVSRFEQVGNTGGFAHYRATIVPWVWLLTRTADCRIFQKKSVPEIIEEVFKAHGFTDYELKLSGTYKPWEYCVQYRETDFNFVSRLMEQVGIYYYFDHENGKHTLVMADSPSAHGPFPGYETIEYSELEEGAERREVVTSWSVEKEVQPGAYALNDFEFKKPRMSLRSASAIPRQHGASSYEIYDYPGEYNVPGDGDQLAKVRLEELQAQHEILRGESSARGISTGAFFGLKYHPRKDQNRDYLITGMTLRADSGEFASSGSSASGEFFECSFTCMPYAEPFRAPRLTPKPIVQGLQTAIIVGPKGEEIHTDEFGRVKVQFHWDRYAKADENSSCWIRVSQSWAGKQWGAIYLPRIGQEVIVEFLEGDPDRPMITGRVYNGEAMPPYDLPAEKTKSTLKSNSSKGGNGFNEFRFEDKKGEEQIFIHGEKDQDIRIKNDVREWVGNDRNLDVVRDQKEIVQRDRSEDVKRDHSEEIGRDHSLKVKGNKSEEITGQLSVEVKKDVAEVFKSNHYEETTKQYYLSAKEIVIEAGQHITIQVGKSFIAIDPSGITISTPGVLKIESKGPATVESKAVMSVKAAGPLTVQGAIVKIN
jgi:type VI secretion system secreted protein VgrG